MVYVMNQDELIIKIEQFKNDISNIINTSNLPLFVLQSIIEKYNMELTSAYQLEVLRAKENIKSKVDDNNECYEEL